MWRAGVTRSLPLSMTENTRILGRCPDCDDRIPTARLLIEYERGNETKGVWAECPGCETVVSPE